MLKTNNRYVESIYLICLSVYISLSICAFSYMGDLITKLFTSNSFVKSFNVGIAFCLVIIYFFKEHNSILKFFIDVCILIIFSYVTYTNQSILYNMNQNTYFHVMALFLICADCTKIKKIVKVFFFTVLPIVLIHIVFSQFGIITDAITERFNTIGHSFGFYHYAHINFYVLFLWLAYMYIKDKEMSWIELCINLFIATLLYKLTTLRLVFYLQIIIFVMYILIVKFNIIKLEWKITRIAALLGYPFFAALSFVFAHIYSPEIGWLQRINKALSGRIQLGHEAFNRYDIYLLGQPISPGNENGYFFIDCGYIYELLGGGLVFFVIILLMYTFMLYYACIKCDKHLFIWLVSIMIFTFVNDAWVNIAYTPIILGFFIFFKDYISLIKQRGKCNE